MQFSHNNIFSFFTLDTIYFCVGGFWLVHSLVTLRGSCLWLVDFTIVWVLPMTAGSSYTETRQTFMSHFVINWKIIGLRAGERHVLMRFIREYLRGRLLTSPLRVFPVHNRLCCCSLLACCPLVRSVAYLPPARWQTRIFICPLFLTVKIALFCKSSPYFPPL